jgi:hypothetical protein
MFRAGLAVALSLTCIVVLAAPAPLCLRAPSDAPVSLHGMPNHDKNGGPAGAMLYPAPGLAGFVGGLMGHAFINGVMRDKETARMYAEADVMLQPYQSTLAGYKHNELVKASLEQLGAGAGKRSAPAGTAAASGETLVDSMPAFYMTQDQRALVLENAISVLPHGAASPFQQVIRIVSPVQAADTTTAAWFDNHAALLRRVSARMLAQSIDIALADAPADAATAPFRTVRYPEGGIERMERAQVIREHCGQLVLRTLRGNLMAVPAGENTDVAACPKANL